LLALDPERYLLDEPHNHLNLQFQYRLLDRVSLRGSTVLTSFHDINLAGRYCDEVLLLDRRHLVGQGPVEPALERSSALFAGSSKSDQDQRCRRDVSVDQILLKILTFAGKSNVVQAHHYIVWRV